MNHPNFGLKPEIKQYRADSHLAFEVTGFGINRRAGRFISILRTLLFLVDTGATAGVALLCW